MNIPFKSQKYLVVENLLIQRNHFSLGRPFSFVLNAGEMIQVNGRNGSGKSTLLHTIAGLHQPLDGRIENDTKKPFGYLAHLVGLHPNLTVQQNWYYYQKLMGSEKKVDQQVIEYMKAFQIESFQHHLIQHLSAGVLQKVKLMKLLMGGSMIWLLDEPTSHLDQQGLQVFYKLIRHMLQEGVGILMVEHKNVMDDLPVKIKIQMN